MLQGEILSVVSATHDHGATVVLGPVWFDTPVRVVRWGMIVEAADWDTDAAVLELFHATHIADGTGTEEEGAGGTTLTPTDANIGTVFYTEPITEVVCKPGDYLSIELTAAGTSGDIVAFLQYQKLNWNEQSPIADYEDTIGNRLVDAAA